MPYKNTHTVVSQQQKNISLHDLQQWMRWIIVDPRGVKDALHNPHPKNLTPRDRYVAPKKSAYEYLKHRDSLDATTGLHVYAEGYFSRLLEIFEYDFSITKKVLGEDLFVKLVIDYLKVYPSHTTSITDVGKFLPKFVKTYTLTKHIKYLKDLVDLEWCFVESFLANNVLDLNLNLLSNLTDDEWNSANIIFDPAFRLCRYKWPVHELLSNFDDEKFQTILTKMGQKSVFLYLYRVHGVVKVKEIDLGEFEVLSFLKAGNSLGALMELIDKKNYGHNLTELFAQWTDYGLIKEIKNNSF